MAITKCSRVKRLLPERSCIVLAVFRVLLFPVRSCWSHSRARPAKHHQSLLPAGRSRLVVLEEIRFSLSIKSQSVKQSGPALRLKQGQTCLNMDLLTLCSRLLETSGVSLFKQSGKIGQREESSSAVVSGTLIRVRV